jgi:hypothetical protein
VRKEQTMKKQTQKKLVLSTQTLRNLDPDSLVLVDGGKTTFVTCTCPKTARCTNDPLCL